MPPQEGLAWAAAAVVVLALAAALVLALAILQAYVTLRRARVPVVFWWPKFWRLDGKRQRGGSLRRVLERTRQLDGPYGIYGTVYGTQAVLHVVHPVPALAVLQQNAKSPAYDHFRGFCGRGVFTADGKEWRAKRTAVNHALFRRDRLTGLDTLVNVQADALLRDLCVITDADADAIADAGAAGSRGNSSSSSSNGTRSTDFAVAGSVDLVPLLQRHTLNLIHRFLTGRDVADSAAQTRLLPSYLAAITRIRMVILARSRGVWALLSGTLYRLFSDLHSAEAAAMGPIREFSRLALAPSPASAELVPGPEHLSSKPEQTAEAVAAAAPPAVEKSKGSSNGLGAAGTGVVGAAVTGGTDKGSGWPADAAAAAAAATTKAVRLPPPPPLPQPSPMDELRGSPSHTADPSALLDESITLLFAGQDTSAATLSWLAYLLSRPGCASLRLRLRDEVVTACGERGAVTAAAAGRLRLVDAVVREAQRLFPVAPFVVRTLREDVALPDGTVLPRGALACVWIYCLHRHPDLWSQPDDFLPERWLRRTGGGGGSSSSGGKKAGSGGTAGSGGKAGSSGGDAGGDSSRKADGRSATTDGGGNGAAAGESDRAGVDGLGSSSSGDEGGTPSEGEMDPGMAAGAFMPFAAGPRGCVGQPFAHVALRVMAARLCRELELTAADGDGAAEEKGMQAGFTVLPEGGVAVRCRRWRKPEAPLA
ncbi:unnamed protein product [Phaeothamnion confervicola]